MRWAKFSTCRAVTSRLHSRSSLVPERAASVTAFRMAASGFLSSWASIARNSFLWTSASSSSAVRFWRASWSCRSSVLSRMIFRKPRISSASSFSGMTSPWAQNGSPPFLRCQRSSRARPSAAAVLISWSAWWASMSSGVKMTRKFWPSISASL